jgi:hypothetical protein
MCVELARRLRWAFTRVDSTLDMQLEARTMRIPGNLRVLATAVSLIGLSTGCVAAVEDEDTNDIDAVGEALQGCQAPIPEALAVPAGNRLAFSFYAEGEQIYDCKAGADGISTSWVFRAPRADLYNDHGHLKATHYEGPTWEALDGSTVVGTKLAATTVDATAIPWLLLQASAHAGNGRMSRVSYIQRINTTDGLAPSAPCTAGQSAEVDYTATYNFYEPVPGHAP